MDSKTTQDINGFEWLKPDRVMKLYRGSKSAFGTKRLYVIGIGKNGLDCLLRAKHIADNRFQNDKARIRFLAIGIDELFEDAEFCGSSFEDKEKLVIDPEEAIYQYLNHPEKMTEFMTDWFDDGLKNYTQSKPIYGLQKRQCARLALFHYFGSLMKIFNSAFTGFSGSDRPLEIALVGNLGDAFFGGMMIDLGYILSTLFETADYPVSIVTYMFAGDTSEFTEKQRGLATAYANTIVAKSELDMFQSRKVKFWQQYSNSIEISSDKPPFTACYITEAEKTYEETLEKAALKIMCSPGSIFSRDDDAERLMSYNMLEKEGSHSFRYLAYSSAVNEIPLGKIISYLALKLFGRYLGEIRRKAVGEAELGKFAIKVMPSAMMMMSKAGTIPRIEYSANLNPLFSLRSLKKGAAASKRYVDEQLKEMGGLCHDGAEMMFSEQLDSITKTLENAVKDKKKGPYYALGIVKNCTVKLSEVIKNIEEKTANIGEDLSREERLLEEAYKKVKAPGFSAGKHVDAYIERMKSYADIKLSELTSDIVKKFYIRMLDALNEYSENVLRGSSFALDMISEHTSDILYGDSPYMGFGVREAFDPLAPENEEMRAKLDKMLDDIPKDRMELGYKRAELLEAAQNGAKEFVQALLVLVDICVGEFTEKGYDDICAYFNVSNSLSNGMEDCFSRIDITTPTTDGVALTRVICPSNADPADIAPLRALHKEMNDIWNASASSFSISAIKIQGSVKLDKFRNYEQWENMRYAYVNDSLKKHGIHIFN